MDIPTSEPVADPVPRAAGRGETVLHLCALAGALLLAAITARQSRWDLVSLLLLIALTTVSDLMSVTTGAATLEVSGSFLGLMVTAVLLGGSPAALIGVLSIAVGWLKTRGAAALLLEQPRRLRVVPAARWARLPCGDTGGQHRNRSGRLLPARVRRVRARARRQLPDGGRVQLAHHRCPDLAASAARPSSRSSPRNCSPRCSPSRRCSPRSRSASPGSHCSRSCSSSSSSWPASCSRQSNAPRKLHRLATTDDLTGLANRELFRTRLEQEIECRVEDGDSFGILLIDLDGFKEINDTLGHDYGDVLLQELGPRFADTIDPAGLIARLGGDEFAVLPAHVLW